jgi:hypothetical protein
MWAGVAAPAPASAGELAQLGWACPAWSWAGATMTTASRAPHVHRAGWMIMMLGRLGRGPERG